MDRGAVAGGIGCCCCAVVHCGHGGGLGGAAGLEKDGEAVLARVYVIFFSFF